MNRLESLRRLLAESSDPDNPPAERVRSLFETMRRVAVIGLSRDTQKAARRVPAYLAAQGYEIVPVNPFADRLLGREAHPDLAHVEDSLDLVVIFRPSRDAGAFVSEAASRPGHPAIWLQEGIRADDEVAAARAAGRTVVQDLCTYKVHRALFT